MATRRNVDWTCLNIGELKLNLFIDSGSLLENTYLTTTITNKKKTSTIRQVDN